MIRRQATRALAIAVAVAGMAVAALPGCGSEERGPTLSGGREVKSWIADLHSASSRTRREAVLKLGNAADSDPAVADALGDALQDTDPLVRRDAIRAVVKLKQPGALIKQRLEAMSRGDHDSQARELAGKALARLGDSD